ncbi:MAG TPA: hypothetical protein VF541_12925, partial [Longimicrobium sp.]
MLSVLTATRSGYAAGWLLPTPTNLREPAAPINLHRRAANTNGHDPPAPRSAQPSISHAFTR